MPAGPNAEHDVVLLDGVEVAPLVGRLGGDAALPRLPELAALEEVLAQVDFGVVGEQLRRRLDVADGDGVAFDDERRQLRRRVAPRAPCRPAALRR